ncbi:hypothetical protein [uncultured Parabacteroides sp.]|uniref:hypothetical protein n=1 Tax=uncultured Parabacteroides sp. TaxID=512312 RepID=UPI002657D1B0|nr:hypothetical protein [uncultured Parabacteroides sp.]
MRSYLAEFRFIIVIHTVSSEYNPASDGYACGFQYRAKREINSSLTPLRHLTDDPSASLPEVCIVVATTPH